MPQSDFSRKRTFSTPLLDVMKTALLTLAALTVGYPGLAASSAPTIEVREVNVHLLLIPSGELSEDIAAMPSFSSGNFRAALPIKPVDEEFRSYLIKVRLEATRAYYPQGNIGSISVRSARTKRVLYTSAIRNLHITQTGQAVVARFVEGYVCEPVDVIASVGNSRVTKRINFECGE